MQRQRNRPQMKEQEDSPKEVLNEMEVSNLSNNRIQSNRYKDAQQHDKGYRNHKKDQSKMKNVKSEIKNTLKE